MMINKESPIDDQLVLSIVIPMFNASTHIGHCLQSIAYQQNTPPQKILCTT